MPAIVRLGDGQVGRPGRRDHAERAVPVDEGGGDRLAQHLEGRLCLHVAVAQAGHVTGVTDEVGDAVGVEPDEIGFDQELGGDPGVVGRDGERLEHRRGERAERLGRHPYVGHGSPAWGTSTRIVRITPVPLAGDLRLVRAVGREDEERAAVVAAERTGVGALADVDPIGDLATFAHA